MTIEICANSFASTKAAQEAGADRIELCTELSVGGLTPSHGLLKKVTEELSIPVHVLVRPRSGDFTYSDEELDIMIRDIEFCKKIGCAGIVSGALTKNKAGEVIIDQDATQQLIHASEGMEFTFHRGFDWTTDPLAALDQLTDLKVDRLLTSGQATSAIEGISVLKKMKQHLESSNKVGAQGENITDPIQIMPGGGINVENVLQFKEAGFVAVHFSATRKEQILDKPPKVPFHSEAFFEEGIIATSDVEKIKAIQHVIN